jgi:hypothetical protein
MNPVMRYGLRRIGVILATPLMITSCGGNDYAASPSKTSEAPGLSESEAADIATEAYVHAYPLVSMEFARRGLTNVPTAEDIKAPMGQIARMRVYPKPSSRTITAPNADTLYTQAWLNLSKEPWVVTVPDMGDRYFLLPMMDAWTNVFASPGTRNGGGKPRTFAITGPGWHGIATGRIELPVAYRPGVAARPDLLLGHPGRLRRRARAQPLFALLAILLAECPDD